MVEFGNEGCNDEVGERDPDGREFAEVGLPRMILVRPWVVLISVEVWISPEGSEVVAMVDMKDRNNSKILRNILKFGSCGSAENEFI